MAAGAPKVVEVAAAPGCAPNSPEPVATGGAIGFAPNKLLGWDVTAAPNPVVVAPAGAPKEDAPKAVPEGRKVQIMSWAPSDLSLLLTMLDFLMF